MPTESTTSTTYKKKSLSKTILWAGFIAGTLDILSAILIYKLVSSRSVLNIFYFIASGVFGKAAFSTGPAMAVWGLIFHFIIAYLFTIFFFLVYPKLGLLKKNWLITGLLYGIFVWFMMNLVVVPLSKIPSIPLSIRGIVQGMAILMLMIGLPLAFMADKYYSAKQTGKYD